VFVHSIGQIEARDSEWLTAEEAAAYLKIKTRTLLLWVRQQKVRGYALSGITRRVWRFRKSDLDAMLLARSVGMISSIPPSVLDTKGEER
jgi:excisionase family DNA binding protein